MRVGLFGLASDRVVMVPKRNQRNLMLEDDVLMRRSGRLYICVGDTADSAMDILTERSA